MPDFAMKQMPSRNTEKNRSTGTMKEPKGGLQYKSAQNSGSLVREKDGADAGRES